MKVVIDTNVLFSTLYSKLTLIKKIATLKTLDYLEERAEKGSRSHALELLDSIDERKPLKEDLL